jgi:hypothetical protein
MHDKHYEKSREGSTRAFEELKTPLIRVMPDRRQSVAEPSSIAPKLSATPSAISWIATLERPRRSKREDPMKQYESEKSAATQR